MNATKHTFKLYLSVENREEMPTNRANSNDNNPRAFAIKLLYSLCKFSSVFQKKQLRFCQRTRYVFEYLLTVSFIFMAWNAPKFHVIDNLQKVATGRKLRKQLLNCNYILFTKLPWPEDSEGTSRSSSQAATCPPVYHTRRRLHNVPLIAEGQAGKLVNTNFYCLWFDPTGNRTRVYRFSSRRSIHSTSDRFTELRRRLTSLK